jgi:xanthine dehydrogenase YagS FAD-binding subunit
MNRFALAQPRTFAEASALLTDKRYSLPVLKGGGIDLVDHLKEGLTEPDVVVNLRRVRMDGVAPGSPSITEANGKIQIEAETTLTDIVNSPIIREKIPVLAQALEHAASLQVRNVATAAGNLLQRPRCWYYRHSQTECLKKGGSTCFAVEGENKYHAIFGDGPCHIVHPSNSAPAYMICDGVAHVASWGGEITLGQIGNERTMLAERSIPFGELFHMPDKGVRSENNLKSGEVITHITCTPAPQSGFYAVKEKQSFDWPLCTAYVVLDFDGAKIKSARVCAGAVAPIPWLLPKVDEALKGIAVDDDAALRKACAVSTEGAKPMTDNAYKLKLLPATIRRAVLIAAGRPENTEVA